MNIFEIEQNVQNIISKNNKFNEEFIFDLLMAYAIPKNSITRLKKGTYNQSKILGEVLWKGKVYFKYTTDDLHLTIEKLLQSNNALSYVPRFVIVTDYSQLVAVDTKTKESLDIKIIDLQKHFVFFLPWAGMEKTSHQAESIADIKAASKMARLYDEIVSVNPYPRLEKDQINYTHNLNIFFSRLLFCFFADDTGIFPISGQFVSSASSHTQNDGSDLDSYIAQIFESLNTQDKKQYPKHVADFPYVNGGLFASKKILPKFNRKARRLMLDCGDLDWSQINPDIFGSMIQAVVRPSEREALGMHYTSVENIMKVIKPLFLEDLYIEFEKNHNDNKKLTQLLNRIYSIKIFDPACGSGNFLVIAYKELRKLEHKIFEQLSLINNSFQLRMESGVKLENFYGIEIDDFAAEIARLSLWLAKHQMNLDFEKKFGISTSIIPLRDSGQIVCENAARIDWNLVCPKQKEDEVYLIGNPPYQGSRKQDSYQKEDFKIALPDFHNTKSLDYISIWFFKGSEYIANLNNSKLAFVSTNSIIQGEQVSLIWPKIFELNLEIFFCHTSFKWDNLAKNNAGVICVVIGIRNESKSEKFIFSNGLKKTVKKINGYLVEANNVFVSRRAKSISSLPKITFGSMINDGGNLILSPKEANNILQQFPIMKDYIKKFIGSYEYINGLTRYCLVIPDEKLEVVNGINEISKRLELVKQHRLDSSEKSTRAIAENPNRFYFFAHKPSNSIIIPRVSSERRDYIPIGYLSSDTIISDSAMAIYDSEPYVFGLLNSKMHMVWVRAVAGRLKTDFRYSSSIVYNNFPVPDLSEKQKKMIENHVFEVLAAREDHSEKTLANLYDPDLMPDDLKDAHEQLDEMVELCYRSKPFDSDEERLSYLFKLYETMIEKEKES